MKEGSKSLATTIKLYLTLTSCSVKSQFNNPESVNYTHFFPTTKLRHHNAFHHKVLYKAP